MYSKKNGVFEGGDYVITPPPGYDGSRFGSRSDGRDDAFPPYDKPPQIYSPARRNRPPQQESATEECKEPAAICVEEKEKNIGLFPFLKKGIGQEELLIIALLIVIVMEKNASPELILMLGLLLCI